jgi:hypothetical protein
MKAHVDHDVNTKEVHLQSAWGTRAWLFLLVSAGLIAPLSLFVHDFMLETLKVPYPTTVGLPMSVRFLDELVRLCALAAICRLARPQLQGLSRTSAALSVGLLLIMLNEAFRVFVIESAIVGNWSYSALDNAPRALSWFIGSSAIAWIGLGDHKRRNVALAIILIAALVVFAIHPALDALCAALKNSLSEPRPLYADPYPFKINVLIYATFIEPTIATFVMVSFCWPALGGSPLRRTLAFTALLLLVRGRVIGLFVESFWVKQPLPTAFLAQSQFFFETLTLGLLVALAWNYAWRIQRKVGRGREEDR